MSRWDFRRTQQIPTSSTPGTQQGQPVFQLLLQQATLERTGYTPQPGSSLPTVWAPLTRGISDGNNPTIIANSMFSHREFVYPLQTT